MTAVKGRPRLVIVDARAPAEYSLRAILDRAAVHHDVQLVTNAEHASEIAAAERSIAMLVHARIDQRPGMPALGPLIASFCRHRLPSQPLLLYADEMRPEYERALAQLGLRVPVVFDGGSRSRSTRSSPTWSSTGSPPRRSIGPRSVNCGRWSTCPMHSG